MNSDENTGFNRPMGMKYSRFLSRLHDDNLFDWYMEVGCRSGDTFKNVRGKTIAVDPFFKVEQNVIQQKPELYIFQRTSDDFFASNALERIGATLSFSFLDGMHLFEFLLRDFINTEAHSGKNSAIALHDCCPYNFRMTTRDLNNLPRGDWTGDVWKLLPILQEYRPDLTIDVLPCKPTGLILVSDLNPNDATLSKNYEKIVAKWEAIELSDYGPEKFYDSFEYVPALEVLAKKTDPFKNIRMTEEGHSVPRFVTP
ncbi:class I SAM-dependent methyltransferase [Actibacterium pelagium]|uniref:Methyltransferase domain-containing protein n=1 Tax=Actibacterium pelagium TaxID=2029103 RepID=A0A917AFI9_9RHOB|nr:hypothetical protein [Actibacterium pelagium]GGE49002.1 hypothetical protein GCM10011517_16060 [Actibacterium pelagium]